jgi:hypothetical protein
MRLRPFQFTSILRNDKLAKYRARKKRINIPLNPWVTAKQSLSEMLNCVAIFMNLATLWGTLPS